MPQQEQQKKKRTGAENVALATNAAGAVGGPAAIYGAYRAAKNNEGGIPRTIAQKLVGTEDKPTKLGQTSTGKKIGRGLKAINTKSGKGKAAAVAAGVGGVALQGANWAGDTIAAKTFAEKGKSPDNEPVKKSGYSDSYERVSKRAYASRGEREDQRLRRADAATTTGMVGGSLAGLAGGASTVDTIRRRSRGERADLLRGKDIKRINPDWKAWKPQETPSAKAVREGADAVSSTLTGKAKKAAEKAAAKAGKKATAEKNPHPKFKTKRVLVPTKRALGPAALVAGPTVAYGAYRSHQGRTESWR